MSAPQFTPGPWQAWIVEKTICVLNSRGNHSKPVVTWTGFDGCNRPLREQRANARLIAAAPELYQALEKIAAGEFNCSPHQRFMAAQGIAEAALAKARGEA